MPIGAIGASLIGSGLNFASSAMSNLFNRRNYKKSLDYNSPKNQMARLKAAGLNPHLIYGSGSATQPAAPPPKMETPNLDPVGVMAQYQNFRNAIQNEKLIQERVTSEQKRQALMEEQTSKTNLDNLFKGQTWNTSLEGVEQRLALTKGKVAQQTIFNSQLSDRLKAQLNESVQRAILATKNADLATQRAAVEKEILRLREADVNPNSPMWEKILGQLLKGIFTSQGLDWTNLKF